MNRPHLVLAKGKLIGIVDLPRKTKPLYQLSARLILKRAEGYENYSVIQHA